MSDFIIVTDSSADLPKSYIEEHGLVTMSLSYTIDGETYSNDYGLESHDFYERVRNGKMPTTSQVNPEEAKVALNEALEKSNNLLVISFSSGLSGTYNSTRIAASEIMEERDDVNIIVIDSLAASLGQGLLVHKAVCMRDAGESMDTVAKWVEDNKNHIVHAFTVSNLFHLSRGGRLSKAVAVIGTIVNLKPLLFVDDEGHLINYTNVRGRKKSLKGLVDYMDEHMGSFKDKNDIVFISHGDNEEDAKLVAEDIKARFGIDSFLINPIGPTIGAHAGPDTIALFFMGDHK